METSEGHWKGGGGGAMWKQGGGGGGGLWKRGGGGYNIIDPLNLN